MPLLSPDRVGPLVKTVAAALLQLGGQAGRCQADIAGVLHRDRIGQGAGYREIRLVDRIADGEGRLAVMVVVAVTVCSSVSAVSNVAAFTISAPLSILACVAS